MLYTDEILILEQKNLFLHIEILNYFSFSRFMKSLLTLLEFSKKNIV